MNNQQIQLSFLGSFWIFKNSLLNSITDFSFQFFGSKIYLACSIFIEFSINKLPTGPKEEIKNIKKNYE